MKNLILIVADDMGYGDFGAFSDGSVRTPNLDRLVDEGVTLTQHYAGSPVCSPSRAALLTGRYPHRTGAITPQEVRGLDRIALDEVTLGDAFRLAGYRTGLIGKWHNGALDDRFHPNARGFDEFTGFRGGWADYWDWRIERNGVFAKSDGRYLTDVFTDEAVSFIDRHRPDPFFLVLAYNAPHSPLHAPDHLVQPYVDSGLTPPVATTYAMIESMDTGVGRILDKLDETGLADDTLVMFTSDNGPAFRLRADQVPEGMSIETPRYNAGFRGTKGTVYEGGIRVPMILRCPSDIEAGRGVDGLVHFTDWFPTLLGLAGASIPDACLPLDGIDIRALLHGRVPDEEPRRFWQWNGYAPFYSSNAAMRDGSWKLVRPALRFRPSSEADEALLARYVDLDIAYKYRPDDVTTLMSDPWPSFELPDPLPLELYDLASDPAESRNLAEAEPARASRMLAALESWAESVEADRLRHPDPISRANRTRRSPE